MESISGNEVVVFGASGFIGQPVVDELLKNGFVVHFISRNELPDKYKTNDHVKFYQLDIMDLDGVNKFFGEHSFSQMIDLAWYCGAKLHLSLGNLDWTIATLNAVKAFIANGGRKVLVAGSVSEYDFSQGYLVEGKTPLTNKSMYGRAKAAVHSVVEQYCLQAGVEFKWAHIFNLFGCNEKPSRLMPSVINSILHDRDVEVSACTKIQDYSFVEDTAAAIVKFFASPVQGAVNICSGTPIKLRDIVLMIAEKLDFPVDRIKFGALPTNFDEEFICGSNLRLRNEVGYEYRYSISDGLDKMINYMKGQMRDEQL